MAGGGGASCSATAAVPSAPSTMDSSARLHDRRCLRLQLRSDSGHSNAMRAGAGQQR
jgi:hypothetical protein